MAPRGRHLRNFEEWRRQERNEILEGLEKLQLICSGERTRFTRGLGTPTALQHRGVASTCVKVRQWPSIGHEELVIAALHGLPVRDRGVWQLG